MRRSPFASDSADIFGPGTDLVVSLFAVLACVFSFVVARDTSFIKLLRSDADKVQETEQHFADQKAMIEFLEGRLSEAKTVITQMQNANITLKRKADVLSEKLEQTKQQLVVAKQELSNERAQIAVLERRNEALAQEIALLTNELNLVKLREQSYRKEVLGLKGDLKNVVFVVDASGSMVNSDRWEQAQAIIEDWLRYLPVKNASVVMFNQEVKQFPSSSRYFQIDGDEDRKQLVQAMQQYVVNTVQNSPDDMRFTNTLKAIEAAYAYSDVDTICLFTDGRPNYSSVRRYDGNQRSMSELVDEVLFHASLNANRRIVVNTIGLGDYFRDSDKNTASNDFPTFRLLLELAKQTGGSFRGR